MNENNLANQNQQPTNSNTIKEIEQNFPDWYVSISFGKSRSKNYPQAVSLAKMAPQYIEQTVEENTLHQAVYSDDPDEYLQFIKLYELVNNWKSHFVVINGQMIDRKIIGKINYCYGDKCRSGNPDFCYGASQFTRNPFGCHRLQISAYNNPWWSFGIFDTNNIWHVDKDKILERIKKLSKPYRNCPSFSMDKILNELDKLPSTIDPAKNAKWTKSGKQIIPEEKVNYDTINIELDTTDHSSHKKIEDDNNKKSKSTKNESVKFVEKIIKSIQKNGWQLKIEFEKSQSKYYSNALELAKTFPQYNCKEVNEKHLHQLEFTIEEINNSATIDKLLKLIDYIKNWKDSHFYINDIEVGQPMSELNCYKGYLKNGKEYCFDSNGALKNQIGCRWSGVFGSFSFKYVQWNKFGKVKNNVCYLDKKKIKQITYKNIQGDIGCPQLGTLEFLGKIENLPDIIDIKQLKEKENQNRNYFKKTSHSKNGGCLTNVILMILTYTFLHALIF